MTYEEHRASGATSLVRCFRITRRDGETLLATEHDENISLGGETYLASAALEASDASASLGLAADEMDISGAVLLDGVAESDILKGIWDGARVEIFDVNFRDARIFARLGVYQIGEIERGAKGFRAEIRSGTANLDRPEGRSYISTCDASLGDTRCSVALDALAQDAVVLSVRGAEIQVAGLSADDGFFDRGNVEWLTGPNQGQLSEVRVAVSSSNPQFVRLWSLPRAAIGVGDQLRIRPGCNKTFAACRDKFSNVPNFRGFPHMAGEGVLSEYAVQGAADQDGGSRFDG